MKVFNPYNFVPIGAKPDRQPFEQLSFHNSVKKNAFSGYFDLEIQMLTPVFIPSTQKEDWQDDPHHTKTGIKPKRTFRRVFHQGDKPAIPGTSIKGMIRSVYEAITKSCMALFAETYSDSNGNYLQYPADEFKTGNCNPQNGLCSACSVFGTLSAEGRNLKGKVRFTDAVGGMDCIESGEWILKPLLAPKPERHAPFYAKNSTPAQGPRGRKFYFHHNPDCLETEGYWTTDEHTNLNKKILQRFKQGKSLFAKVFFDNLGKKELANLVFSLELGGKQDMAHKIGMGKPLGLGSIRIQITDGKLEKGADRYRNFSEENPTSFKSVLDELRNEPVVSSQFSDLFSVNKFKDGKIEYPDKNNWFNRHRNRPLGDFGEFDETSESAPPAQMAESPDGPAPWDEWINGEVVQSDRKYMIINAENGKQYKRPILLLQGVKLKDIHPGFKVQLQGKLVRRNNE